MPARLDGVQQRLHGGRRAGDRALLGDPGELHGLPAVPEVDGLPAHRDQDVRPVHPVTGRLRQPQRLDEVALGEAVRADVVGGPAGQPGQIGRGAEQAAPGLLPVGAAQHRLDLVLQVADEGLAGVAAAVGVVEGAEQLADRAQRGDVAAGDPLAGAPLGVPALARDGGAALGGQPDGAGLAVGDAVVGAPDQPVAAGDDETGRGEGDLAEFGVAAGVLAPQPADDVYGLLRRRGELQSRVDGGAGVEAEVLGAEPAAESPGEDLGDQRGRRAAGLLPAQPPRDGGLVVSEVESVFEAELVHTTGQTCVGEPRFCDECGELAVGGALRGSFRHLRCGLLPSGAVRARTSSAGPPCTGHGARGRTERAARIASEQPFLVLTCFVRLLPSARM